MARDWEVPPVELRGVGGRMDLPAYFDEAGLTPTRVRELCRGHGVEIVALDASLRLIGGDDQQRQEFLDFARLADTLGVRNVRAFDGEGAVAAAVEAAAWWDEARAAEGIGARMIVETHDALADVAACERFMRDAPPSVGLLWDSHHTFRKTGEPMTQTWPRLRPWVEHVHVKDSVLKDGRSHNVLPGDGELDNDTLLAALTTDGFDGVVSLEWERHWQPHLPPLPEALARCRQLGWW